jgi:hypothetical protein
LVWLITIFPIRSDASILLYFGNNNDVFSLRNTRFCKVSQHTKIRSLVTVGHKPLIRF